MDRLTLNFKLFLAGLALITLVGLCVHRADAATAELAWSAVTKRVDGTAVTSAQLKEYRVYYGVCAVGDTLPASPAVVAFAPTATTGVIPNLAYGKWCFAMSVVDNSVDQNESARTGIITRTWLAPPEAPVFTVANKIAYEVLPHPIEGTRLGRAVGTVPLGTACGNDPVVSTMRGDYHEVALDAVTLSKRPKSAVIVAQCKIG